MDTVIAISQVLSTMFVAVALLINGRQARHAGRQVETARRAQVAQGTMEVVKLLTNPEMRTAAITLRTMINVPYDRWTDDQKAAVTLRCNNFDVAGMFVRADMADERLIADGWAGSLRETYGLAIPHIAVVRKRFNSETHWSYFEWLAGQSAVGRPGSGGAVRPGPGVDSHPAIQQGSTATAGASSDPADTADHVTS